MSSITKRKLDEAISILDSLTSSKRHEASVDASSSSSSLSTLSSGLTNTKKHVQTLLAPTDPLAQYRPWDTETFMKRLGTYKLSTWADKPITPVDCARYGWINFAKDRLQCRVCFAQLIIQFEDVDEERERDLITQYRTELASSHKLSCPWRGHPCDESLYRFPLKNSNAVMVDFQERASRISSLSIVLPIVNSPLSREQINILSSRLSSISISSTSDILSISHSPQFETSAILAVFGWHYEQIASQHGLKCGLCLRVAGMWNYKTDETDIGEEREGVFDVVTEHRSYCPWVSGSITEGKNETNGKVGWEWTLDVILRRKAALEEKETDDNGGQLNINQQPMDIVARARSLLNMGI